MGKRFALIGLDGSGKSANICRMKQDASFSEYKFVWARWKPTLLKPAYWLLEHRLSKQKKHSDKSFVEAPDTKDSRSELHADDVAKSNIKSKVFSAPLIRGIWLFFSLTDYLTQFYLKILILLISGKNIVFDRFYLDLFVDQGINFGYSPERIGDLISRYKFLFPKIDHYIYVRVSPAVCYSRKDDIPNLGYLNKRYEIYEHLSNNSDWICVDGELSFEEVYDQIQKIILR